jgi:peptidoglycan/xylan/chitin deacetylase (PgdA/CDA1 family)
MAKPPQFVMLAFDGSKNVAFWEASRQFAKENNVKFTYFASGVYFLTQADAQQYLEPKRGRGKSAIGFGGTVADMKDRLHQMKLAMEEGHEIASHANGHFDGSKYTADEWNSEFDQFTQIMSTVWDRYRLPNEPAGWKAYFKNEILGFRAPLLGVGNGLYDALRNHKFRYDTSRVKDMSYWPKKINNIWSFPLAQLTISGSGKKTLSMDYNFYYTQSGGQEGPPELFPEYEREMYDTYMAYFNFNYHGNRAPVHIGHHFSLWNGGAYWKAMQRFAAEVSKKEDVICGTYKDLLKFVSETQAHIAEFDAGHSDRAGELTEEELQELKSQPREPACAHDEE